MEISMGSPCSSGRSSFWLTIVTGSGKYYSEGGVPVLRPLIANLLATEEYAELEVEEHDEGSLAIRGGRIGAWARARRRAMS